MRARALAHLKRGKEAYDLLQTLSRDHPDEASIYYMLAWISPEVDPGATARYAALVKHHQRDTAEDYYLRALAETGGSSRPCRVILMVSGTRNQVLPRKSRAAASVRSMPVANAPSAPYEQV